MKRSFVILLVIIMIASLAACQGSNDATEAATSAPTTQSTTTAAETQTVSSGDYQEILTTANVTSDGAIDASEIFTERDLRQNADLSEATSYTLSDNSDITITSAGIYLFSGSAKNVSIIVDAGDDDKVQIILSGVTVTNDSAPCIYVKNADKTFVTTAADTVNSLTVSGSFTSDGDTNTDAVIFSKDDLVLNGLGTLEISSADNGVSCKDDLKITGGAISITCESDALEANDSIAIADGTITISTRKDGLHAENDEDDSEGYIYICGGTLSVTATSDGIQATTAAQIDGGTITITAREGIEATYVQVNGGDISISASDDGINASNKSSAYTVTAEFNGGNVTINMGQGDTDGVDSNGNLYVNGGTINITGNSPFDYDGQAQYNGGTIIVNGETTNEITNQFGGMGGGMGGQPGGQPGGRW